jgi:hypothetical protein
MKKEYMIYYILFAIAVAILGIALISGEITVEVLSVKLINLSLGGGAVYLIKTFDFKGVNFSDEILKNNVSAGIVFTGICILVGLVLGAG